MLCYLVLQPITRHTLITQDSFKFCFINKLNRRLALYDFERVLKVEQTEKWKAKFATLTALRQDKKRKLFKPTIRQQLLQIAAKVLQ